LNAGGRIVAALAPGAGTLSQILVARGDKVKKGQVVARIVSTTSDQQVANARGTVAERDNELRRQRELGDQEIKAKQAGFEDRRAALKRQAETAKARVDSLTSMVADQEKLLASKTITRSVVLQTQAQLDQAKQEINDVGAQSVQIDSQELDLKLQVE